MIIPSFNKHIYFACLEFKENDYVDECNKYYFLRGISRLQREKKFDLYGFCIMDFSLCVMTGNAEEGYEYMKTILREIFKAQAMEEEEASGVKVKGIGLEDISSLMISEMHSTMDVVDSLCYIHILPVEMGYVTNPEDYWWSSIQLYKRDSQLCTVNKDTVYHCLSRHKKKARELWRNRHRAFMMLHNPKPSCLQSAVYNYDRTKGS